MNLKDRSGKRVYCDFDNKERRKNMTPQEKILAWAGTVLVTFLGIIFSIYISIVVFLKIKLLLGA